MKDTKTSDSSIRDLVFLMLVMFGTSFLSPSAGAQELKKVRIGYPAFSLTFLTFFVAKDAGIYKKHGLDVDMVQMAGAVQTSALVAGEIDYLTGITSPLVAAARGLPFKGIMITHERTLFWIIANPDIRRMEDLIGKTVAVDRLATLQDIVARDLVKRKGVNPEQVTFVQTGSVSNSVQSLSQGSVAFSAPQFRDDAKRLSRAQLSIGVQPALGLRRDRHTRK
jgi:ABC-type nitrate/sulfonate/bicarbonate transport system substrate-binding protein